MITSDKMIAFTSYKPGIFVEKILLYFGSSKRYSILEGKNNIANAYGVHRFEDGKEEKPTHWIELK